MIGSAHRIATAAGLLIAFSANAQPSFPVPRAEPEFRALLSDLAPRAAATGGDVDAFVKQSLPYGPLDLTVANAANSEEAEALRNFYLGVLGGAARVDVAALAVRFQCGRDCAVQRRQHLAASLPAITEAVDFFRHQEGLSVVAVWPTGHRLDDYYLIDNRYSQAVPSPIMGFVPSGSWLPTTEAAALERLGVSRDSRDRLLSLMSAGDLAAVAKERNGSVRAIWAGIADNEAGILSLGKSARKPKLGEVLPGGGSFVVLERLADGIYFYTTN
jgi:hypothetical protein